MWQHSGHLQLAKLGQNQQNRRSTENLSRSWCVKTPKNVTVVVVDVVVVCRFSKRATIGNPSSCIMSLGPSLNMSGPLRIDKQWLASSARSLCLMSTTCNTAEGCTQPLKALLVRSPWTVWETLPKRTTLFGFPSSMWNISPIWTPNAIEMREMLNILRWNRKGLAGGLLNTTQSVPVFCSTQKSRTDPRAEKYLKNADYHSQAFTLSFWITELLVTTTTTTTAEEYQSARASLRTRTGNSHQLRLHLVNRKESHTCNNSKRTVLRNHAVMITYRKLFWNYFTWLHGSHSNHCSGTTYGLENKTCLRINFGMFTYGLHSRCFFSNSFRYLFCANGIACNCSAFSAAGLACQCWHNHVSCIAFQLPFVS